jgi:hypothetical protein
MNHSHDLPPELLETARMLEHHRPSLTEPELAAIKQRAAGPASRRSTKQGGFMRSRLAIMALLATGALMSSGGAALGVSALSTDLTASSAQYGAPSGQAVAPDSTSSAAPGGGSEVLGTQAQAAAPSGNAGSGNNSAVAGARTNGTQSTTAAAQAPRQISASTADQLPFTGYAAIPMLFFGLLLLGSGLVLRRSSRRAGDTP